MLLLPGPSFIFEDLVLQLSLSLSLLARAPAALKEHKMK